MTTRENLIPDDQEYGERQANRDQMREAGVPTETTGPPALAPQGPTGTPAGFDDTGDIFSEISPSMPLLDMPSRDPNARLREMASVTQNPFMRAVLEAALQAAEG